MLLHFAKADLIAGAAGQGVFHYHVINAGGAECGTHFGIVLNRDALVIDKYAGSGISHLIGQFGNGFLLLFED